MVKISSSRLKNLLKMLSINNQPLDIKIRNVHSETHWIRLSKKQIKQLESAKNYETKGE